MKINKFKTLKKINQKKQNNNKLVMTKIFKVHSKMIKIMISKDKINLILKVFKIKMIYSK